MGTTRNNDGLQGARLTRNSSSIGSPQTGDGLIGASIFVQDQGLCFMWFMRCLRTCNPRDSHVNN
ncbi:unnamed protein product [Clonostachys solani]|uniref:Uncharacterized protein n=1 Tax=Clonostachys solani TaxID=160281 RepID=A0A9P0EKZ0_9HYPO|nr:unnamed protein product [Clonostachys solani]